MTALYRLTGAWAELQRRAEDGEDVTADLAAITDAIEVKAERCAAVLRWLQSDQDTLKAEEERLRARRKALEANEERLREHIKSCMLAAGLKRVKSALFTLSLSERASLQVLDAEAVPPEYVRIKITKSVDTKAALDAHNQHGECVPGTAVNTIHVLTIR